MCRWCRDLQDRGRRRIQQEGSDLTNHVQPRALYPLRAGPGPEEDSGWQPYFEFPRYSQTAGQPLTAQPLPRQVLLGAHAQAGHLEDVERRHRLENPLRLQWINHSWAEPFSRSLGAPHEKHEMADL